MPYPQIKAPVSCRGTQKGGFVTLLLPPPPFFIEREIRRKAHGIDLTALRSSTKLLEDLWDKSDNLLSK